MKNRNILVIENNIKERLAICEIIDNLGYNTTIAFDGIDAYKKVKTNTFQLIFMNFDISGLDSINFIKKVESENEDIRTIFFSSQPSVENAVFAMKSGALDFILKPFEQNQIKSLLKIAFNENDEENNNYDSKRIKSTAIITQNKSFLKLIELAKQVADSRASILIQGESGTGKELFARFIHENSNRKNKNFVAVNCAALPETLLESELFGHEKGAFTGAISRKMGKFELSNGGTILLDEITEMQFHLQSKLLRVLQEREIDRVGGARPVKIDVRVIATTNRNIKQSIEKQEFREDLFYRLNVVPIRIPPLRERKDDIALLAQYFIQKYNEIDGRNVKGLTKESINKLNNYNFNGNVRELENIIERAILLANDDLICEKDLFIEDISDIEKDFNIDEKESFQEEIISGPIKDVEKKLIFQTLDKTNGNRTHAANLLGISVRTLRNKLNEYKESMGP